MDRILEIARWAAGIENHSSRGVQMKDIWTTLFAGTFTENPGQYDRSDAHPEFDQKIEDFNTAVQLVRRHLDSDGTVEDLGTSYSHVVPMMTLVLAQIGGMARGRRLASTRDGILALVPGEARENDVLSIFHNTTLPFILRPEDGSLRIVGACFIHGMMDGEVFENPKWKSERIVLC